MLAKLTSWFTSKKSIEVVSKEQVEHIEEEIPRYPPFAKGIPVTPIDKVLDSQSDLIKRIKGALDFNDDEFNALPGKVIRQYAEFVHHLPASEAHHHRGAGGLFRHGLEVAFWAAQASGSGIFAIEGTPRERRDNEPKWRLACCIAGMLHDVGKPLSDMSVTNSDGSSVWSPYSESLFSWADNNQIKNYFIRWRSDRHKRHERFALLTIERLLTREVLNYLYAPGPVIIEAILEAVAGTGVNDPVTKLVLKADQESVSRDLKQSRLDIDEFAYGVPVERYIFDAIRRLVNSGQWKVNEPGAFVWHCSEGLFIAWRQALPSLYQLLDQDKTPGIPRHADTLADILIERDFAIPRLIENAEGADTESYRYWEIKPKQQVGEGEVSGEVKLLALKLESVDLVYTTEPPATVEIEFVERVKAETTQNDTGQDNHDSDVEEPENEDTSDGTNVSSVTEPDQNEALNSNSVTPDAANANQVAEARAIINQAPELDEENPLKALQAVTATQANDSGDSCANETPDPAKEENTELSNSVLASVDFPFGSFGSEEASEDEKPEEEKKVESKEPRSEEPNQVETKPKEDTPQADSLPSEPRPIQHLECLIEGKSEAAELLSKAMLPVLKGEQMLGEIIYRENEDVVIPFPSGARKLGSPGDVSKVLFDCSAIVPDPVMGQKVRELNGQKVLVLATDLAEAFIDALTSVESELKAQPVKAKAKKPKKKANKKTASQSASESSKQTNTPPCSEKQVPIRVPEKKAKPATTATKSKNGDVVEDQKTKSVDNSNFELSLEPQATKECTDITTDQPEDPTPKVTHENVLNELSLMIKEKKGRWIVTPVREKDGCLTTSAAALDRICDEYDGLIKNTVLKMTMRLNKTKLEKKGDELLIRIDKNA